MKKVFLEVSQRKSMNLGRFPQPFPQFVEILGGNPRCLVGHGSFCHLSLRDRGL